MKGFPLALLFATASAFAGIPESPEITGKVVDAESGRPIPGALVVANVGGFGGSMFGHGHHRQLHCTAVRADDQGRFRIPAWTWSGRRAMSLDHYGANLIAYHPEYNFYSPGKGASVHYPISTIPLIGALFKPSDPTIPMQRFAKGDASAWDFKLGLPLDWFRCDWDADVKNADLVWEAMHEEVEVFDATNPVRPLKSKLNLVTKRPEPPPPPRPPVREIPMRSPTDRGSGVPAITPSR